MKYFLFFFFIIASGYSQTGKVSYSSVLNFGKKISGSKNDLYFTNRASIYRPQLQADRKSKKEEVLKQDTEDGKAVEININVGSDSIGSLYFNDLTNQNLICREPLYKNKKLEYFIYEDAASIKWQLTNDFKEISGYKSQKAITTFRGRNFEAWFTSEIPLAYGPWKFRGLPGLILEVYDQTGSVYFIAEHIQIPFARAEEIVQRPSGDPLVSHRDFIHKNNETSAQVIQALRARLSEGSELVSTEVKKEGIELEYEWEKK